MATLRSRAAAALLVFAAALAVRLAYVAAHRAPAERIGDAQEYHSYAVSLLDSGRYEGFNGLRAARMPGYPLFLSALYSVFGRSPLAVQAAQSLLGAGTCVLILLAAWQWYGPGWGLLAGFLAAGSYDLLSPSALLLSEAPATFLLTLSFYLLTRLRPPSLRDCAAAGLCAGAACLVRPEVLPFAFVCAALAARLGRGLRGADRLKGPAVLLGAFFLCLAPWALRNARTIGRPLLTSTAGPYNLYRQGLPRTVEERLGGVKDFYLAPEGLGELEKGSAYSDAARRFYLSVDPVLALKAVAINIMIFYYPFLPQYDPTLVFLLPWAFWGLWLARKDDRRWTWAAWAGYLTILHCFVAVMDSRYRQALAPSLILLAVGGLETARLKLGRRRFTALAGGWALANAAVWALSPSVRILILPFLKS